MLPRLNFINLLHNIFQAYQLLMRWKAREGRDAQTAVLEKALRASGMADAAMLLI
jgi:hypothetical protein